MTNAELLAKIKAEIERRITDNTFGAKLELIDILAWLDTLESEKPMNQEGLEEEYKYYVESDPVYSKLVNRNAGLGIARHFVEWGYLRSAEKYNEVEYNRQRAEECVPKDLEEAAREFAKDAYPDKHNLVWMFKRGAKWQKEQMMKEAVGGEVTQDNLGNNVVRSGVFNKDFEYGDKVRIIILPKED